VRYDVTRIVTLSISIIGEIKKLASGLLGFRYGNFEDFVSRINELEGSVEKFALGFQVSNGGTSTPTPPRGVNTILLNIFSPKKAKEISFLTKKLLFMQNMDLLHGIPRKLPICLQQIAQIWNH
jgi:hypothetical protein